MKIVHFSDWHGSLDEQLPEADLYVCTGDMLPNFTSHTFRNQYESSLQMEFVEGWIRSFGSFSKLFSSKDAPVVCVRGNHDYIDLKHLFSGCNFVHEFVENELIEVNGLKITGHRGIPYIYGTWNDEIKRDDLKNIAFDMPSADIYLTHYGPQFVLDSDRPPNQGYADRGRHYGLEGLSDNLLSRGNKAVHCFGHVHECTCEIEKIGSIRFSNAALGFNVIEF